MPMRVGPACYNPAPVRLTTVEGILNPFQQRRIVARQARSLNAGDADTILRGDDTTGYRLYTMEPMQEQTYMLLDIRPIGTLLLAEGDPVPPVSRVNGGNPYTYAGARLYWPEAGGFTQMIDVDIGAGVVFTIPPTNFVQADLLLPDPAGIDQIPVPDGFSRLQRFASTVSCKVTCVSSPSVGLPTIQRAVYIDGGQDFGSVGQQVPIPKGASSVQIFSSPAPGNALPVDEPENTIASLAVEPIPLAPGVPVPAPLNAWPSVQIPFLDGAQTRQTPRVRLAADFNVIRIRTALGAGVRRNVFLVFEIDL